MKKILILLLFLLSVGLQGQIYPGVIATTGGVISTYEAEYQSVLNAMTTDPTGDTLTWQNTMIKDLVDGGLLDSLDGLWIFACTGVNTNGEALINWINPSGTKATKVGNPVWGVAGYTGTGTINNYIDLNWDPVNDGSSQGYGKDHASIGVYSTYTSGTVGFFGADEAATSYSHLLYDTDGSSYSRINATASNNIASELDGNIAMVRRASNIDEQYQQGNSVKTESNASAAMTSLDFWALGYNSDGVHVNYATAVTISIVWVGGAFSDGQIASLSAIFETYMDAIGHGVQ